MVLASKTDIILNNLKQIEEWSAAGKSIRWIAQELGVGKTLLYKVMSNESNGLKDTIKKGRDQAVEKLESCTFDNACGFERVVKKTAKLKRVIYENGKKAEEYEEMVEYEETQYFRPDTTAAIFLLKNWANYCNEPATNDIRKEELELKKKQIEANSWE